MDLYWPYLAPCCVVVLSALTGNRQMVRTALAIFVNYWVNTVYVEAAEIYDPWYFYMLTDALTAWIVLIRPAGKPQSLIGWSFIAQVIIHVVYGVSKLTNPEFDTYSASLAYWQILLSVAVLQLVILGGWVGGHWWRRYTDRSRPGDMAGAARSESMAQR